VSVKDKKLFFNKHTHPGNRDFYKMNISDGLYSRSDKDGAHEVNMSPDGSLLVRYSYKK
jgi:hypothetical protein